MNRGWCACAHRIRTPDSDGGFYERDFARLEGQGSFKEKEEVEVALLKAQALVCEKDVMLNDHDVEIKNATAKGALIANLMTILGTGQLIKEQMVTCKDEIFMLGMDPK